MGAVSRDAHGNLFNVYGYIYLTTNNVNGKKYIGQHKSNVFDKNYVGSGKLLRRAVELYGKHNFSVQILAECGTKEEMDEKERHFIEEYHADESNDFYNITKGGQDSFFTGLRHTCETKRKISEAKTGRNMPPTTEGRIYIHFDSVNRCIEATDLDAYLSCGYLVGKFQSYRASWNKGKTAENDETVAAYSKKRRDALANGERIGFCGARGEDNIRVKQFNEKLMSIDKDEFISFWEENSKTACIKKYHLRYETYERICALFGIVETEEHLHKIRVKAAAKRLLKMYSN